MNELRRVSTGLIVCFALIALTAGYWGVVGDRWLLARGDNPRTVEAETVLQRGAIFDEQGFLLATTTVNYNGRGLRRLYPHPEVAPAVGYYSQRYGTSGIEAAYDNLLRGNESPDSFDEMMRRLEHMPAVGGDVRLTLNLQVQKTATEALGSYHGAVVVATVPDGAIRAMVSAPVFDPNALDADWDVLVSSPDAPLLNRVTQGLYQPGGVLETSLMAMAISERVTLTDPIAGSTDPIQVNGLTLTCGETPPESDLNLTQAYLYACPGAFAAIDSILPLSAVDEAFWRFGLLTPPHLLGLNTETADSPLQLAYQRDSQAIVGGLVGQGALTISPLQTLELVAAIANDGNIPLFHIVDAIRQPGRDAWESITNTGLSRAVLTRQASNRLKTLMHNAAVEGLASAAQAESEYTIMGHASTAFSGPEAAPLQWFIGIAELDSDQAVAIVVVLEGADNPAEAARIGGRILNSAARFYDPSATGASNNTTPRLNGAG